MENKPKQTAVEFIVAELENICGLDISTDMAIYIIEQAKEMEKQQIIETARFYFHERGKATPEQYYIEEYAKNTNN